MIIYYTAISILLLHLHVLDRYADTKVGLNNKYASDMYMHSAHIPYYVRRILVVINTNEAPKAIGPYSQAIMFDRLIFTSGQLPLNPKTGRLEGTEIEPQTRQAICNLETVLKAGGSSLDKVLKTTVLLKDMNDFSAMNKIYAEFFKKDFPGRSAVQVVKLPMDALVEIEAVAAV